MTTLRPRLLRTGSPLSAAGTAGVEPGDALPSPAIGSARPELAAISALQRSPPLYVADLAGNVTFASDDYRELTRSDGGDGVVRPPAIFTAAIADIERSGSSATTTICIGERQFAARHDGIYDAAGHLIGVVGTLSDVSDRVTLGHATELAQERLADITRLVSDWVWETDASVFVTYVSPRIWEALGRHPRELIGAPFHAFGTFDTATPTERPLDPNRRLAFRDLPFRMTHADGSTRLFHVSALPIFATATGAFVGYRGTARDVTNEVAAWDQVSKSRRQLHDAIESISEGFGLFDAQDRLVLCNRKLRDILPSCDLSEGQTCDAIMTQAVATGDILPPQNAPQNWLAQHLDQRRVGDAPSFFHLSHGRWMRNTNHRAANGSTVSIWTDISELKNREGALIAAKETAEVANKTKSDFLANISHELRTPLNAIIGFCEIMRDELLGPIGTPQYRDYLRDVLDSAHHLLGVINDILDVSKAEAGKLDLMEDDIDAGDVARAAVRLVRDRAQRSNITLNTEIQPDLPAVYADERKLKQILLNLLTNAVKFTNEGGTVSLTLHLDANGDLLAVVTDTGIGIAPEHLLIALTPFGQIDGKLNRKFEGTGLGLPLSRAMTELHGGTLSIESELGVGTSVCVRLPANRVRHEPRKAVG